ncbi:MAG: hypothetical protein ACYC0B_02895 [Gemmatimonadaceae bacterium]
MTEDGSRTIARGVAGLPQTLMKAYDEVCAVLESLRQSRDVLHRTTVSRLQHTTAKLQEVTDATEVAATGILDGLDRSIGLVDELERLDTSGDAAADGVRGQLRDELFQAQAALQFQDITAQQLTYAASLLVDMEERLLVIAQALDPSIQGEVPRPTFAAGGTFDPGATMKNADGRQALADAIFTVTP